MTNLPQAMPKGGNGETIEATSWDPTNHQFTMPQSLPGIPDSSNPQINYAPRLVAIAGNTGIPGNVPNNNVQKVVNASTGNVASIAAVFGKANTSGNSIVVVVGNGNNGTLTVTDSNSNVYQSATPAAVNTVESQIFFSVGPASGGGIVGGTAINTVTVANAGTAASMAVEVYEVSGLIALVSAQPDVATTNTGTSGTASTSVISPASTNELAFAGIAVGTAAQTITAGSGWTNDSGQQNPTTPSGLYSFVAMSQFLGSLKTVIPQATFTSEPWAMAVATFRPVILGIGGTVFTSPIGSVKPSYTYAISATAPYATPTDWIVIRGSATKTVKIVRIEISGAATAATEVIFTLKKHTVANTSGTATNPTFMQHDSNDAAATALILLYSVAPTIDSSATIWKSVRLDLAVAPAATTNAPDRYIYNYAAEPYEPLVLRGVAQEFAINFASAAVPSGGVYDVAITITEDNS